MNVFAINFEAARDGAYKKLIEQCKLYKTMVVVDESLCMGDPGSMTTRSFIDIAREAAMFRELNGTPITQNVENYYGQLKALGALNGVNRYAFRNRYAVMGGYMGKKVVGIRNEEELTRLLASCSFRALKKDWRKDLPPKIYKSVNLEMTAAQLKHYRAMHEEFCVALDTGTVTADLVLTQRDKLRQISSGILLDKGEAKMICDPKDNPKLQATIADLEYCPNKSIVVHYYRATGQLLREQLSKKGRVAYIKGQMQPEELAEQKDRFNNDPECRVIVCQEGAAFRGHTLIGQEGTQRCTNMVFFENSLSYYERAQMEDRNHRGEADQACTYSDLITSPMDQNAVDIVTKKKNRADSMDEYVRAMQNARL